jgi:hypothetical protein
MTGSPQCALKSAGSGIGSNKRAAYAPTADLSRFGNRAAKPALPKPLRSSVSNMGAE